MEDFYRNLKLTSVILSGGGTYGIKMLHLLHQLDTIGSLKDVKYWSGTSVGAICALCMTVGIQPRDIIPLLDDIQSHFKITPQSLLQAPDTYGLVPQKPFRDLMESVLEQHGILPSVTFRQLHRITQLSLSIFATCVDTNELVSFHHTKTPDVKVIDAVLASCCIPLIFPIYTIETKRYIDGGMISDWSIDTDVMDVSREKTLLIRGTYETAKEFKPIQSFMDYIHYLLHQGSQNIERLSSQMRDVCESLTFRITIPFGTHSFSLSHLHEDPEEIQKECNEILNRYANL